MKSSLLIILFFCLGVVCGRGHLLPEGFITDGKTVYLLYCLMGCVGVSLGCDRRLREILYALKPKTLLFPLGTTIGTFLASALVALALQEPLSHCLAVGSGFAYYSLSSILISQQIGSELGTVALICNVLREILTLLLVPAAARFLPPPAVIAMGGATTMDTTLPLIARTLGPQWAFVSVTHAVVLDFSVPFWVTFFCSL
ncbi:MAG: lysine exporter LysO family protein [Desulfovibrionaceae bacterium]|nr:lysine exporter LysO family protein [Desulfovibrionaceae bacterium]